MFGIHRLISRWASVVLPLLACLLSAACDTGQRHASIGDLPLASGEVLSECQVGYRTFGALNEAGDNAILLTTWLAGTSAELLPWVGEDGLADPDRHFIVLVDALGNGVSSSPSDGTRAVFPDITVEDMVESQRLLLEMLGVRRLRAVIGTSMGGMQALEWGARHPDFVDAVVAIASSPRLPLHDRLRWEEMIWEARLVPTRRKVVDALREGRFRDALWYLRHDPENWIAQAQATQRYNLAQRFGRSLEKAARALPPLLAIVSSDDPVLDPAPSRALAESADAQLVVLDGSCGHHAPGCEKEAVVSAVRAFLEAPRRLGPSAETADGARGPGAPSHVHR